MSSAHLLSVWSRSCTAHWWLIRLGPGREATAAALGYAWEHWDGLHGIANPVSYLFRVGQSQSRNRKVRPVFERPEYPEHWYEPKLATFLLNFQRAKGCFDPDPRLWLDCS